MDDFNDNTNNSAGNGENTGNDNSQFDQFKNETPSNNEIPLQNDSPVQDETPAQDGTSAQNASQQPKKESGTSDDNSIHVNQDTSGTYSSGPQTDENNRYAPHTDHSQTNQQYTYGQTPNQASQNDQQNNQGQYYNQYQNQQPGYQWNGYQSQPDFHAPTSAELKARRKAQKAAIRKEKKERRKKKGGLSGAVIAILIVGSLIIGCGAGFFGSYFQTKISSSGSSSGGSSYTDSGETSSDGTTILYRYVENTTDNEESSSEELTLEQLSEEVSDTVVEITTEFVERSSMFQYTASGAGSGVVISDDGYIITNNHVIYDSDSSTLASTITVTLHDGTVYDSATIVGRDSDADIAVLKVDATGLTAAVIGDSDSLKVGQSIAVIGNPLGELGGTFTQGIISSTDREISVEGVEMNLLQTDAAINPGNSGGGMFDMYGNLIGIVNAKASSTSTESVEGLGFAIPVNDAISTAQELMENGYVTGKPYIGVSFYTVSDQYTAARYFNSTELGVYVVELTTGYNESLLQYGDRVVSIDGNEITSSDDIASAVKSHAVGDTIEFTIVRDSDEMTVDLTVYEKPGESSTTDTTINAQQNNNSSSASSGLFG